MGSECDRFLVIPPSRKEDSWLFYPRERKSTLGRVTVYSLGEEYSLGRVTVLSLGDVGDMVVYGGVRWCTQGREEVVYTGQGSTIGTSLGKSGNSALRDSSSLREKVTLL